jgi:hypothetical protein
VNGRDLPVGNANVDSRRAQFCPQPELLAVTCHHMDLEARSVRGTPELVLRPTHRLKFGDPFLSPLELRFEFWWQFLCHARSLTPGRMGFSNNHPALKI